MLEWAYSYSFSPAILEPLSSGTLLWDHLAGVNTFPTKPAWMAANVNAALHRVMEIPGSLGVRLEAREHSIPLSYHGRPSLLISHLLWPPHTVWETTLLVYSSTMISDPLVEVPPFHRTQEQF